MHDMFMLPSCCTCDMHVTLGFVLLNLSLLIAQQTVTYFTFRWEAIHKSWCLFNTQSYTVQLQNKLYFIIYGIMSPIVKCIHTKYFCRSKLVITINGERFTGLNFRCYFRGFVEDCESFSVNILHEL